MSNKFVQQVVLGTERRKALKITGEKKCQEKEKIYVVGPYLGEF